MGLKILKFFDADPESGIFSTLDPGWNTFGSEKHPGSATQPSTVPYRAYTPDPNKKTREKSAHHGSQRLWAFSLHAQIGTGTVLNSCRIGSASLRDPYLELERLRPVNLDQSVQEGRDGTGETTWVSGAFTLSLSAFVP